MAVYKVYISSTLDDLPEYRSAARDAVMRMGMLPLMDDNYGMVDATLEKYLDQRVKSAQVFIGIYAHRYGQLLENETMSFIEMEYNCACRNDLISLFFFIHPDAPWPASRMERGEGMERMEAFKARIMKESVFNYFTSPESLQAQIYLGLHQSGVFMQRREGVLEVKPLFGMPDTDPQFKADVFMIMPFAQRFRVIYTDTIVPMMERMGWSIKRGDDYFSRHAIIDEIWTAIYNAKVVVAEVTDRNPNVYYELGLAHALGKPSILITQDINDIPFDLRHLRIIEYAPTTDGLRDLQMRLEKACQGLMSEVHS